MPVTLPSFTRRELLQQSALASLGLVAAQTGIAADDSRELWVLLSDTHIAEDQAHVEREVNCAEHLKRTVNQVLALQAKERAFGLFVNGDLALKDGQAGDYFTFVELMKPLRTAGIDLHLTMGNHDDREKFWNGCGELDANRKLVPLKHLAVITSALVNWVLLDSLDKVNSTPGLLGESQLAWLDRTLRDVPDKPTIVMVHHNPQTTATIGNGIKVSGLVDSEQLIDVIDKHPKVKALIFGHTHNWETKTRNSGLHLINLPPVAYAFNKARPEGWVIAHVDAKGIDLELRSLNPAHPEHGQKKRLDWSA